MDFQLLHNILDDDKFRWLEWSPNGEYLALASTGGSHIGIWETKSKEMWWLFVGYYAGVDRVAWSPDGRVIVSGCVDGAIHFNDIKTKEIVMHIQTESSIKTMDWSPDGQTLASGSRAGIYLWDTNNGESTRLANDILDVDDLVFSPDGRYIAFCNDFTVQIWNIEERKRIHEFQNGYAPIKSVDWSPDGRTIVFGAWDKNVYLWDVTTGTSITTRSESQDWIVCTRFSSDGKLLAGLSKDGYLRIWSCDSWECIGKLAHDGDDGIGGLAFHPTNPILAVRYRSGHSVKVWQFQL